MPSFDITSEVDMPSLKNAVDVANRKITNRYDFKGSDAKAELNEKDKTISLHADNDFQLDQMQGILLPEMTSKSIDVRCLDHGSVQKVGGNKVKQELKVKVGIEQNTSKKIVAMLKDSKMKVQASIQGEAVRVTGAKRDILQEAIALVKEGIKDVPLQFGNFRD
ncbi:MAG: YajQ family cyclic di-GMP-binding protein [Fluviibacter sp.]|jgi:cyclic-di-GMP-binding protein|nr:YajQ family cyclic di-GMP-binding protein [Rhodocyclales bacterium]